MADARIHRAKEPSTTRIEEIDILWMTAGLGCDGDTIAITAATQPSLEDIVTGALPWIPTVQFYNPFLVYENGDDFLCPFRDAADGKSEKPFILVVEGSIPGPVIRTSASHRGDTDVASKVRKRGKNHISHEH